MGRTGNHGGHVGDGRLVCADRRERASVGGVGIGGVLEPVQAAPVIVEDGAFIGSRVVLVEGVRIGREAVIAPGVVLTGSVPVIDVTGPEPVEHRGSCRRGRSSSPARAARSSPRGATGCRAG